MTDKVQKIKEEIERRINLLKNGDADPEVWKRVEGVLLAYNSILQFIDSLPEEHNEDLEEEIQRAYYDKSLYDADNLDRQDFNNIARHFAEIAEWQKQQMKETLQTKYEKGRSDMREEMMKNTVLETKVMMDCDGDGIETSYEEWLTLENTEIPSLPDNLGLKDGDKVKIIIYKIEQQ